MLGIGEEISIFLQALLSGCTVLLAYDCIRVVRRLVKHNLFFVSLEDFFFWFGTGLYLFIQMYNTSDGSIRWFFTIGVVAGVILAFGMLRTFKKIYQKTGNRIREKNEKSIEKSRKTR